MIFSIGFVGNVAVMVVVPRPPMVVCHHKGHCNCCTNARYLIWHCLPNVVGEVLHTCLVLFHRMKQYYSIAAVVE